MKKNKKNSSGRANKKNRKGIVANIRNVCVAINHNLVGGIIIAILFFFIAGVANAVFSGFFTTCGIVIKDSSRSLLQKIVDVYYISAAKFEPTDLCLLQWGMSVELLIVVLWFSLLKASQLIARMEQDLNEIQPTEKDGDQINASESSQKTTNEESLSNCQASKFRRKLQDRLSGIKKRKVITLILSILTSVLLLYSFSSTMVSFKMVKCFRSSIAEIRPFIAENEFHHLNRKWVMMKSRKDYKVIKEQIAEYQTRAEHDSEDRGQGM